MYLSVIIPAYNEASRIDKTLVSVHDYVRSQNFDYEIVVVNDGSTDDTARLVRQAAARMQNISLIELSHNQGKGAAVKAGMLAATGGVRLFMDADGSTSIRELEKLTPPLFAGFDVVVGSRIMPGAVKKIRQAFLREFLGWVFRKLVHMVIKNNIQDSQNGFKLFTAKSAGLVFNQLTVAGWSFDVEVLAIAHKHKLKIKEVPIVWTNDGRSNVRFSHMIRMLFDLARIHRMYVLADRI